MVCKGTVKTPLEGYVKRANRGSNSSTAATAAAGSIAATAAAGSIFASLNMSIFTFHSRLLRCFSRFVRTKQSYKPLKFRKKKKTIVLDLDETLVHSTMHPPKFRYDFMVRVNVEGMVIPLFVVKRPGLNEFLERISKNYKVVVFTAGITEYASKVLDKLDKNRVISQRLYRDSCKKVKGKYVKDLSLVETNDLKNVLIVDDNPFSFSLHPKNGILIKPFVDDMKDRELIKLLEFFDECCHYDDMRDASNRFFAHRMI